MKLPTVPFNALALELPGLASVFANQNCFVEEKQQKKILGIILSIHYSIFRDTDLVPGKIWPDKKLSLLLNYTPGQYFCESSLKERDT